MVNPGSKLVKSGSLSGASAGKSGDGSGPTGSSRSYPKGKSPSMSANFNPQKVAVTKIYVGGV